MTKAQDIFLDHFARLGVFSKVLQLAGPQDTQEAQSNKKEENVSYNLPVKFIHYLLLQNYEIHKYNSRRAQ